MNGNNQPQQEQHRIAERVARLETAIDYQSQILSGLREEMRAGFIRADTGFDRVGDRFVRVDTGFDRVDARFVRVDAEFVRVHEQLMKIRTTDFRILLSICLTTALGTMSLIVKVFGLL